MNSEKKESTRESSAATRRAANYNEGPEWFCEFRYSPVNGLGYEEWVNRRDPSSVIKVGGIEVNPFFWTENRAD